MPINIPHPRYYKRPSTDNDDTALPIIPNTILMHLIGKLQWLQNKL